MTAARPRPADPHFAIGARLPLPCLRLAVAALGVLLTAVVLRDALLLIGVLLALLAAARPVLAWALIVLIAIGVLAVGALAGVALAGLILGVHALHLLATQAAALPVRGRLQLAALVRPLRAALPVQLAAQAVGLVVTVAAGRAGGAPIGPVLGVVALLAVTVLLAVRLRSADPD